MVTLDLIKTVLLATKRELGQNPHGDKNSEEKTTKY